MDMSTSLDPFLFCADVPINRSHWHKFKDCRNECSWPMLHRDQRRWSRSTRERLGIEHSLNATRYLSRMILVTRSRDLLLDEQLSIECFAGDQFTDFIGRNARHRRRQRYSDRLMSSSLIPVSSLSNVASDGVNEYVAVSTDNGQLWRLVSLFSAVAEPKNWSDILLQTGNVNGDQIGVSSPSAVVLMVPREKEASLIHNYR